MAIDCKACNGNAGYDDGWGRVASCDHCGNTGVEPDYDYSGANEAEGASDTVHDSEYAKHVATTPDAPASGTPTARGPST